MYTYVMVPVLVLPMEMKLLRREFFNRWYGLKAFYLSKTMSTIPTTIVLTMIFNAIVYWMADQPMELTRFVRFCSINVVLAIISEGLGILIGITFNCTNGAVVGPSVMAPILMVAMHGMGYGERIYPAMHFLMQFSFMRLGLVGLVTTLYSNGRQQMECKDYSPFPYCHYSDPSMLLRDLGMRGQETGNQLLGLLGYLLLFRVLAFFAMRFRLTTELRSQIIGYIHKIIKH
uniref:ABC-2 type transporter transmembrane domain-containing protein n=2 Tax=Clastoptera arizonana TaxID=38151 RepID=A0A1B6E8X1_9HEMI